ncbi:MULTISPECIES: hypothetical protein [Lysobacter]|jgi:hypothetical protein|uniref:Uncharacterized protein n=2 Tax=Lysobacter TaxID=68 RepID=A0A0S2DP99_LYSEN|nr:MULTISPECIES: hypothetical protein [Lysobacter]ALN60305.1 hypothetical protein GLE_4964 [Lysobacter enzymogenes]UZW60998.1 hypothetical protein BV903_001530 [Lysobacter enzymogenes]WMT04879.1 hypothetical protein RDV84_08570 [Lysobacter yananisis]SDZ27477.1 hypothetical protein SAMN04487939_12948 [Lysobacter sp. yr284]
MKTANAKSAAPSPKLAPGQQQKKTQGQGQQFAPRSCSRFIYCV